ncbi:phosphatidylinositol 4-phosphate 5-kinase 10 isoform X1 [Ziziphus jujuba]|uniref:1-phosphatidylinositol-4-phosphate 5-kinase n=1 Tax=Ziziphus jujuba TaxID=326968 RepID=A0ABM3IUC3_ZIZJJ|nr:phosphatidylinositol 4-phosphate 5-kinase 10 isoform X1 [Ziziphus jujuba]XP_048335535.2 phosphatidylinositol 4-phosphate 5-kinase 10 isoform X1 [Ziziphus jujuba]
MERHQKDPTISDYKTTKSHLIRFSKNDPQPIPGITDYLWKDYCPAVFSRILQLGDVDSADYIPTVCCDETLNLIFQSRGKSGSLLFLSKDLRFVIKTVRKSELKVCLDFLPNYYRHVKKNESSLLTKVYGLHVVTAIGVGGCKCYFVVMSNAMQTDMSLDKYFDLKGTAKGRTLDKEVGHDKKVIHKDQDLEYSFYLHPLLRTRILGQIKYDCEFLEAENIMNYSLLLGIHFETSSEVTECSLDGTSTSSTKDEISENDEDADDSVDTVDTELTFADLYSSPDRFDHRFGVQMPARALQHPLHETGSTPTHRKAKAEECQDVTLCVAIVDLLKHYNMTKRFEHAYKSIQFDSKSISCVNPKAYSSRFLEFCSNILREDIELE